MVLKKSRADFLAEAALDTTNFYEDTGDLMPYLHDAPAGPLSILKFGDGSRKAEMEIRRSYERARDKGWLRLERRRQFKGTSVQTVVVSSTTAQGQVHGDLAFIEDVLWQQGTAGDKLNIERGVRWLRDLLLDLVSEKSRRDYLMFLKRTWEIRDSAIVQGGPSEIR